MSTHHKVAVSDVMLSLEKTPTTGPRTLFKEALELMDEFRLGIVCVVDEEHSLLGIITDGDVRRTLTSVQKPFAALLNDDVVEYAIKDPVTANFNDLLEDAETKMGENKIWDLPVVEGLVVVSRAMYSNLELLDQHLVSSDS